MFLSKWMDKLWSIQTMKYYSALKGNVSSSHGKTWRHLRCMPLSGRNQSGKVTYCHISTVWHSGRGSTKVSGCQDWGESGDTRLSTAVKLPCMAVQTFVGAQWLCNTPSAPDVNCKLWVTALCHPRFVWVYRSGGGAVIVFGGSVHVGAGGT